MRIADQLTRTDNAYRHLLLTAIPALTLTLTLNVTYDKRPGQVYVRSSQLSQNCFNPQPTLSMCTHRVDGHILYCLCKLHIFVLCSGLRQGEVLDLSQYYRMREWQYTSTTSILSDSQNIRVQGPRMSHYIKDV